MRTRFAPFGLALFLALVGAAAAQANEIVRDPLWVTDGEVRAVAYNDNTIFIGGSFQRVGPAIGGLATFDAASGASVPPFSGVLGTVDAIASDGAGGYFIAGTFTSIKGQPRNGLARIDASGVATSWNPGVTGTVNAFYLQGSTLYVGGAFTQIAGQPRANLAAFDATTGALTSWAPNPNGEVKAFASNGTRLFVGGSFQNIGGFGHPSLASFTIATGALDAWFVTANGSVYTMALFGPTLYVGGGFSTLNSQIRLSLGAFDINSGVLSSWSPSVTGGVLALAITFINTIPTPIPTFWIAGNFTKVNGFDRLRLAAIDGTGALLSFNPGSDATVRAMQVKTTGLGIVTQFFIAGDFTTVGGAHRPYIASLTSSGGTNPWTPVPTGPVHALLLTGSNIVAGGTFYSANMEARANLAALDATTGALTPFNPGADGAVNVFMIRNRSLYIGGEFGLIGTAARSGAAELDIDTYTPSAWNPDVHCDVSCSDRLAVNAIARGPVGGVVYIGGSFTSAGPDPRRNIAATLATTGAATTFNVNANFPVHALALRLNPLTDVSAVIAGGDFNRVNAGLFTAPPGGTIRYSLAAFSPLTGEATSWDVSPNTTNYVNALQLTSTGRSDPGILWVGGQFITMGGQPRNNLAAIDVATGIATAWNPNANGIVRAMSLGSTGMTLAGDFTTVGGQSRKYLACVDTGTGTTSPWNPDPSDPVLAVAGNGGTIFAGGRFDQLSQYAHPFFAGIGDGVVTAVEADPLAPSVPHAVSAAPNPTGGRTTFRFALPRSEAATVSVYDVTGRLVRTLHRGILESGAHTVEWNGNDASERAAASGIYFVRVESPSVQLSGKVLRIR